MAATSRKTQATKFIRNFATSQGIMFYKSIYTYEEYYIYIG